MHPIRLRGARTHNLDALDLDLEPGTVVALAGPSGAGKSSLAFSTLYAEGQRRYVESFSAYARQFLERLARPPVDLLEPVPAGIAVDRAAPVRTSRSTVGTMTELTDVFRALWPRIATLHCPGCAREVRPDTPRRAARDVLQAASGERVVVAFPREVADADHYLQVRESLVREGWRRLWLAGRAADLDELPPSEVLEAGPTLPVVVDRLRARAEAIGRLQEALEQAFRAGGGRAEVWILPTGGEPRRMAFSEALHCAHCDRHFPRPHAALFSYNSPLGACPACRGFGRSLEVDWERVLPDPGRSVSRGGIRPWQGKGTTWERRDLRKAAARTGFPLDRPIGDLSAAQRRWLIEGDQEGWYGLAGWFRWLETKSYKMHVRVLLSRYRRYATCTACEGGRLREEARWWRVDGRSLPELYAAPISKLSPRVRSWRKQHEHDPATTLLLDEALGRLRALERLGLGYLSLDRQGRTLSGGETQRVALARALGVSLAGAMFVLDEPTVGLHPRDADRLAEAVRGLAEEGNLVLLVEHDATLLRAADRVVELGPGSGEQGGRIVFDGSPSALRRAPTATGRALRRRGRRPAASSDPPGARGWIELRAAQGHNLQRVDARFPIGAVSCVTGVSGSGKSTLVLETLVPAVREALGTGDERAPLPHAGIDLPEEAIRDVVVVDQAPMGRTSRGNPATYMGLWDVVRRRFAAEDLARERGYGPGFFSLNVPGGRCEACKGEGAETVEMQFLADVTFSCPECDGRRFLGPVLDVRHRGLNVAELLEATVRQAWDWAEGDRDMRRRLAPLREVGLEHLRLGQPLDTLSGGEAQRLKLAEALGRVGPHTLLVLDEPTAGLHPEEVDPLLSVLRRLVARGATVVLVEHEPRVAAAADWVIDLGPGAGPEGGRRVAMGTPAQVAETGESAMAPFLARALGTERGDTRGRGTRRSVRRARRAARPRVIRIEGAREHNLREVTLEVPRDRLIVVCGPSGSGKSTLAFDVLHAEAQRRFLETLSTYARQYLPQLPRPDVDRVLGLPPSVALEQRTTRGGSTSTVATVTEVGHFLRLLWARLGTQYCERCPERPIVPRTTDQMLDDLRTRFGQDAEVELHAPLVQGRKGHYRALFEQLARQGIEEAVIDGRRRSIVPGMQLSRFQEHDVAAVVGRAPIDRIGPLLRRALQLGGGGAEAHGHGGSVFLSSSRTCPGCRTAYPELDPRFFSFNTRQGRCPRCEGQGRIERTVGRGSRKRSVIETCPACAGSRLSPRARSVRLNDWTFDAFCRLDVEHAVTAIEALRGTLGESDRTVAEPLLEEALRRLRFLESVGLGYLGLDRSADTLSGGELQRVRLAAQLGVGLTGALYVLDEPTIGLHPRDTGKLLAALRRLVEQGNTVLVVEHDAEVFAAADHVIDIGPGGGREGGRVVAQGSPRRLLRNGGSVSGSALARPPAQARATLPVTSRHPHLRLHGARAHNLRDLEVGFPLERLVVVTGVSGSGKSTLVRRVLLPATRRSLGLVHDTPPDALDRLEGWQALRRAVEVDQSPIGRTPRSVPATYVKVWDAVRKLLAASPEARARGWTAARFSFNTGEGRCPACQGQGARVEQMSFLPPVLVPCEVCEGRRFEPETLRIRLQGLNAAEILDLEVREAARRFAPIPKVGAALRLLDELGLGYLRLGQPSNTLSGGEAQRLKLVRELAATEKGPTLYVLDEPTTGLHRDDVDRLLAVLRRFVDRGDTVVVIEHQTDVIRAADWVIDLGPEGGAGGGRLVFQGPPELLLRHPESHTAQVLRREDAAHGVLGTSVDPGVASGSSSR